MSALLRGSGARGFILLVVLATTAWGQGRPVAGTVVDQDGRPVENAEVVIFGAISRIASRPRLAETRTDARGAFRVEGVQPGPLLIRVRADGYARAAATVQRQAADDLAIRLAPGRGAVGRVVDGRTNRPIAGARVTAPFTELETDAEGRFEIDGLPVRAERLVIEITRNGYVPHHILVPDGTAPLDLEVRLDPGHAVGVEVVDDAGAPKAGVRVRARLVKAVAYSEIERADLSAVTDDRGFAAIVGLPAGEPLCVEADGLLGCHSGIVLPVPRPASGHPRTTVRLTVTEGRHAAIEVVDGHGAPVAGATVRVMPMVEPLLPFGGGSDRVFEKGAMRVGTTDAGGRASWDFLPAGSLTCEVRSKGRTTRMVILHPTPGSDPEPVRVVLHGDAAPPGRDFAWSASVDDAVRRSHAEGVPILFCMAMDDERANDWMATHHYHDRELIRTTREMPVVLANVFGAGGVRSPAGHDEVDGKCTRYGGIPCAVHQAAEPWCATQLFAPGTGFQVPHHVLMGPDGEILLRREYYLSERDLMRIAVYGLRHVRPERALALARVRLLHLRHRLVAGDVATREQAASDLVALVNSGDEHATALLADLAPLGVAPGTRAAIARGLVPDAIRSFDSALRPLLADPDPLVRRVVAARVSGARDGEALVELLRHAVLDSDPQVAMAVRNAVGVGVRGDQFVVIRPRDGNRWKLVTDLVSARPALLVVGVRDVLTSTDPLARNRLLRILARRCGEDDFAYRLILEAATRDDVFAIPALRALRAAKPEARRRLLDPVVDQHFGSASRLRRSEAMRLAAWVGTTKARELMADGLDDWEPDVQVAAALGRLALRDARCAPILLQWVEDPLRGPEIQDTLRRQYRAWGPKDGWSWRRWFVTEGLIDEEDGAP